MKKKRQWKNQPCPSVARACAVGILSNPSSCKCMWPNFGCPHTPSWQLFSTCLHTKDAMVAALWHDLFGPFPIPCNLQNAHSCSFVALDHHLHGCSQCGWVHRCDANQSCGDILQQQRLDRGVNSSLAKGSTTTMQTGRCPLVFVEDSSVVCSISGVCIRESSFYVQDAASQLQYEDRLCYSSHKVTRHTAIPPVNQPVAVYANMTQEGLSPESISAMLREILCIVCNSQFNHTVAYAKFVDICEKRNAVLQQLMSRAGLVGHRKRTRSGQEMEPVCMLQLAASLENTIRHLHESEVALCAGIFLYVDPYSVLKCDAAGTSVIASITEKVLPYMFRLLLALKTHDYNCYRRGCSRWCMFVSGSAYLSFSLSLCSHFHCDDKHTHTQVDAAGHALHLHRRTANCRRGGSAVRSRALLVATR